MILIILILAVIAFIYLNVIPKKGHTPLTWLSLIIAVLCVVGIVEHDYYNHFGMKAETTTVKKDLVSSASPKLPILLYQPLGNVAEKVYLYKTNNADKKSTPTKTDKTISKVVKNASSASVTVTANRYVFNNGLDAFLFGWFGHNKEIKSRKYIFSVPKTWQVLSVKQAKALAKQQTKK